MGREIRLCVPITTEGLRLEKDVQGHGDDDTYISVRILNEGPASIESHVDEVLAVPDLLRLAREAEQDSVDAVIIDCMGDPGLFALREAVSIPVFGPAQTSMHVASMLGHRFGVVTVLERLHPLIRSLATHCGLERNMVEPRSVEIPVLEIEKNPERLQELFIKEALDAVQQDEADAIILGCTGFYGIADKIEEGLNKAGISGVPVIDPIPVTIEFATAMLRCELSHSKRAFPMPREK
ncbi:MAG: aspartate/glutamate racemase family protein [Arenicellales bacterium]|jgi:allantoin racemase|nr:aspartate/glutamate racemase family protein [Arenicellales bacterium]|tara:strand:- start:15086 stop:15799 length:714 start_codon:yes stop_codon:yes gene_type:complete